MKLITTRNAHQTATRRTGSVGRAPRPPRANEEAITLRTSRGREHPGLRRRRDHHGDVGSLRYRCARRQPTGRLRTDAASRRSASRCTTGSVRGIRCSPPRDRAGAPTRQAHRSRSAYGDPAGSVNTRSRAGRRSTRACAAQDARCHARSSRTRRGRVRREARVFRNATAPGQV